MTATLPTQFRELVEALDSPSKDNHDRAFAGLMKATELPVPWAYALWDDLLVTLREGDNRQRSIAAQVLSNLAKSDPKRRMSKDFAALLRVTKDEHFVTARHCLQSLWKVGVVGEPQRMALLKGLVLRFEECASEKNCTLIRYDILVALWRVYDLVSDEKIQVAAKRLMAMEEDPKYRKKYSTVWRK
ncbi:MAG: hypothetical protein ACKV2U_15240 [Bryobacteraceae bacterium]